LKFHPAAGAFHRILSQPSGAEWIEIGSVTLNHPRTLCLSLPGLSGLKSGSIAGDKEEVKSQPSGAEWIEISIRILILI